MNPNHPGLGLSNPDVPPNIRASYLSAISSIAPWDDLEVRDISIVKAWLQQASFLNKPYNMDMHLGVLCPILSPDFAYTYLINHRKAQMWLPPGGHVDFGVTLEQAACQELEEELGLKNSSPLSNCPTFLVRTLTQGQNAGHIDVTSWYPFWGDPSTSYSVQAKEASQGKWISISEIFTNPQYANLRRGYSKLSYLLGFTR